MKSLILNSKVLEEIDVSVIEFLYLYYLYSKNNFGLDFDEIDVEELEEKKLVKRITKHKTILRQQSIELIEFSLIEADISFKKRKKKIARSARAITSMIEDFVDEYRELWRGRKAGSMGSRTACVQKLTRWIKENPQIQKEQIMQAAKLYLDTEGRNSTYLQRADYFIYKQEGSSKIENSRLSAYIDDVLDDSQPEEDWTSKLN